MKKWSTARKIVLLCLLIVAAVLAVILIQFVSNVNDPSLAFSDALSGKISLVSPTETLPSETLAPDLPAVAPAATPMPEPTVDPMETLENNADAAFMKNNVNILVLGLDESAERANWGSFRTDTMILVSLDFENNCVHMISLPRDSYVSLYGTDKKGKINSAFSIGGGAEKKGFEYASRTVSAVLGGINIHYYVGFDMQVVKDVVNAMGGVDYDVDIEVTMNGRKLYPGQQHLDGQAVLDYCRQRKGSSDIARVERQQNMLTAIFSQLKSTSQIVHIPEIYSAVQSNIQTDLSFSQICSLALFATRLDASDIRKHILDGEFLNMNGISYWGISQSKKQKMIKEIFGFTCQIDKAEDVGYIKAELAALQQRIDELIAQAGSLAEKAEALALTDTLHSSELLSAAAALREACAEPDDDIAIQDAIDAFHLLYDPIAAIHPSSEKVKTDMPEEGGEEAAPPDEEMPDDKIPEENEVPDEEETIVVG